MQKQTMKNALFILSIFALCVALACCVLAILILPYKIVYADSTQEVIFAPVSNLEGNAYATASTIVLTKGEDSFCIPESYYISNVSQKPIVKGYYSAKYCGEDFFIQSSERPQTSMVTFKDGVSLSPDLRLTLKQDESLLLESTLITPDHTIKFLGFHQEQEGVIYVMATLDGTSVFGFADSSLFENYTVSYHPVSQAERDQILNNKKQPDVENGDIIPNTSLALRIVLIIGICVPALVIAILLFKPSKSDRSQGKNTMRKRRSKDNNFDYDSPRSYSAPRDSYDDYERGYMRGRDDARYDARNNSDRDYPNRDYNGRDYNNRDYDNR